jgi:hypothetical protein
MCLICPIALVYTDAHSQDVMQTSLQIISQENLTVPVIENTTKTATDETTTDPVTISALASVAMNRVILNATQNVISEATKSAERILELKEFVLRVSAQESRDTLNLNFSAFDAETSSELAGVSIDGWISDGNGISRHFFSGLTDSSGRSAFTLDTQADELGNNTLTVEAFLRGYSSQKQSAAFKLGN